MGKRLGFRPVRTTVGGQDYEIHPGPGVGFPRRVYLNTGRGLRRVRNPGVAAAIVRAHMENRERRLQELHERNRREAEEQAALEVRRASLRWKLKRLGRRVWSFATSGGPLLWLLVLLLLAVVLVTAAGCSSPTPTGPGFELPTSEPVPVERLELREVSRG